MSIKLSALDRFEQCYSQTGEKLPVYGALAIGKAVIYLVLATITFCQYRDIIVKTNRFLLFSWSIEAVICLTFGIVFWFELPIASALMKKVGFVYFVIRQMNTILFFGVIFRLKSIQIYIMDKSSEKENIS